MLLPRPRDSAATRSAFWRTAVAAVLGVSLAGCLGDTSLTKGPVAIAATPYVVVAPDSVHAPGPILLLQAYTDSAATVKRPGVAQPNGGDYPKSRTGNRVMMRAAVVLADSQRIDLGFALYRVSEPTAFVWSKEHAVDPARRIARIELRASDSVLVSAVTWWSGAKPDSTKVP